MKKNIINLLICIFLITSASITFAETIVLINPFTVPAGKIEESVKFWEKARDFLQDEPGYISTKLHQSIQPDATYQLVNVAEWESGEAFASATQKMKEYLRSEKIKMAEGLSYDPVLYRVIRK